MYIFVEHHLLFIIYYYPIYIIPILFANTSKGATSSANIYTIIETAKANNLVVERYLTYLFENLMPWSNNIPENMNIKEKK